MQNEDSNQAIQNLVVESVDASAASNALANTSELSEVLVSPPLPVRRLNTLTFTSKFSKLGHHPL